MAGTRRITVTAGVRVGSVTEAFSFDAGSLSVLTRGNRAATGSASVTVHGSGFGHHSYTQAARAGDTACEATDWASDTTVLCKVSSGVRGTRRAVMTVGLVSGSLSDTFSYDVGSLSVVVHNDSIGAVVTVEGSRFGTSDYTGQARVGGSACEATIWTADTSVVCRYAYGVGGTKRVVVTVGVRAGSITEAMSYATALSSIRVGNRPSTGSASVPPLAITHSRHSSSVGMPRFQ